MNRRSGHGGQRAGAGRKALLGFEERILIATAFEQQATEAAKAKADAQLRAADPSIEEIEDLHRRIQDVPVEDRQKRAQKKTPLGEGNSTLDDLVGDLRLWVEGEGSRKGGRLIPAPRRIYAQRKAVLEAVAAEATERFGLPISPRFVEGCVEEYRRFFPRQKSKT